MLFARSASMLCAASPAAAMASRCRCTAPSAACTSQPRHPAASSSRARARSSCAARLRALPRLAAARSDATAGPAEDAASELPLWRHLRQCEGFSEDSIARMRGKKTRVTGTRYSQQKVERDLVPTIADLRAEGLDTTTIERLFVQRPDLLNTTRDTFSSALDALRPLAALVVPASAHAVQAPEGATELGVALFLYPTAAARLLTHTNLASLIDGNLRLRRQLGISDAETVHAAFKNHAVLVPDIDRAATKVAHLQGLHVSGKLSAEEVKTLALSPRALALEPATFDRRWRDGGPHPLPLISFADPAARQQEAAAAVGELLQAAAGVQQRYLQQGMALIERNGKLAGTPPTSLRANWASLQRLGLCDSEIVSAVEKEPSVLGVNWKGEPKQRLAAWLQQELGVSLAEVLRRQPRHANVGVCRLAMRAAFLQQHRPGVWEERLGRGIGPLLFMLTKQADALFISNAACTQAELGAFQRAWLPTPDGRRWGVKPRRQQRPRSS